jgi:sulfatase modifying factor 1
MSLAHAVGTTACRAKRPDVTSFDGAAEGERPDGDRDGAPLEREADRAGAAGARPDDAAEADSSIADAEARRARRRCPRDMVDVDGRVCVDRFEASLVDAVTGQRLSPHYPPEPELALRMFEKWQDAKQTMGNAAARAMPLPALPEIERSSRFRPRAVSIKNVVPQGYVSGQVAAEACARAGKRLCSHDEWKLACRGEKQTKFPYGDAYRAGVCNVVRGTHPAQKLHDNASNGHSDPRLGLVQGDDGPLLRPTGATPACASHWGDDAIDDMVGNEDEWIDDPEGTFVGGFFARATKEGCDSIVSVHPRLHWDYSIGFRCCK